MTDIERRFTRRATEVRAEDSRTIGGYAAVFGKRSNNLGGFVELVDNRAFNKSKGDGWPDVIARWNHDDAFLLGTTRSGTLRLAVDGEGLRYDVDVPETRQDVYELVQRGDIDKSSFAFRVMEDDWDSTEDGFPIRTLTKVQLVDVAPVNTPAYPDSSAGLRSLALAKDADLEEVRKLAEEGELSRLFKRTDRPSPTAGPGGVSVKQARMELLKLKNSPYL
ncbi:HK97 family phage prohead protease [Streptomyces sp. NBC_00525]|uniref:HK97 family phage prohead protease n=1 Tax=Streptomyces sp. NBC_00525 TaxID=2903660 RepID=UPI002E81F543|nr:HK97 family phage prohead protease [Streptomyces sp. NBC_00525]WUC97412.1 HK97 family phage prohead protease [Streptomyces sp. NBC_00525]